MVTVHIPKCESPMWECNVNNVVYRYPQDTYQTVPDAVASVIDSSERAIPKQDKTDPATWLVYKQGGWNTDDTGSSGGGCDCSAIRLSDEQEDYHGYDVFMSNKTYREAIEHSCFLLYKDYRYEDTYNVCVPSVCTTNNEDSLASTFPCAITYYSLSQEPLTLYAIDEDSPLVYVIEST